MANEILGKLKTEWSFQSSSYSPTAANDLSSGTPTVVDLSLGGGSGMAATEAMNSDQVDLGATLPLFIDVFAAIEWFAAVTAGGTVDFYWSASSNSVVTDGNPGKPDGVDGDYTGDGGGTVAESVPQMLPIGSMVVTDLAGVQIAQVGTFVPRQRYGQLIVVNNTSTTLCGTDDIESSVLFSGYTEEVQ